MPAEAPSNSPDPRSRMNPPESGYTRFGGTDVLLLLLFTLAFVFITWFRRHGIFWNDEIMGWTTVRATTWHDLLRIWNSGVDSSGFFFYVFARPWLGLFGANELSLHMFSTLLVALALAVSWVCARRFSPLGIVAVTLPAVFLINRIVIIQLSNGRAYGIVLFASALCVYALLKTEPRTDGTLGWFAPTLTFCAFLLLTGSHVLGMLYWGCFFAGFLLRDVLFRRFQPLVYLAALGGLIVVPISWKNLQADIAMGKPTYWTAQPTFRELFLSIGDISILVTVLILLAAAVFLVLFYRRPAETRGALVPVERRSLYCAFFVFAFMILLMFALSRLGKSVFMDRYLIPVSIGDALLLCELLTRISALLRPTYSGAGRVLQMVFAFGSAVAMVGLLVFALRRPGYPQFDYTEALVQQLPTGEPIVILDVSRFIEVNFYRNHERTLVTPLDWPIQLDPGFGSGGASFMHEMEDWKSVGIYENQIQFSPEILKNPRFVVVADKDHTLWFRRYIEQNPESWQAKELPGFQNLRIWQIDHR